MGGQAPCAYHKLDTHGHTFSEDPDDRDSGVLPCAHPRISRSTHFMMPFPPAREVPLKSTSCMQ